MTGVNAKTDENVHCVFLCFRMKNTLSGGKFVLYSFCFKLEFSSVDIYWQDVSVGFIRQVTS